MLLWKSLVSLVYYFSIITVSYLPVLFVIHTLISIPFVMFGIFHNRIFWCVLLEWCYRSWSTYYNFLSFWNGNVVYCVPFFWQTAMLQIFTHTTCQIFTHTIWQIHMCLLNLLGLVLQLYQHKIVMSLSHILRCLLYFTVLYHTFIHFCTPDLALCVKIWNNNEWPNAWKRYIYIPVPKVGDIKLCSSYHAITLVCQTSKILLWIIMKMIERKLKFELQET